MVFAMDDLLPNSHFFASFEFDTIPEAVLCFLKWGKSGGETSFLC